MNLGRVLSVARKELRELMRDRIYLALAFMLPVMMMLLFGYAMSRDVENVPLAILDLDRTATSREYALHFTESRYFKFLGYLNSLREGERLLDNGAARIVIVIPERFQERLRQGYPADVQTIYDGAITMTIRTVRGYTEAIGASASEDIREKFLAARFGINPQRAGELASPVRLQIRYLYNEEIKNIWMMAPALVMIILMWVVPILMGVSVVREKETGSIYNIYSSTISRAEFILGKLTPIILISSVNGFVLWWIAVFYFRAPFRGNALVFSGAIVAYAASICTVGLLASLFVRTQQAALMASIILGAIVAMNYSGVFTPIADMGASTRFVAHLFPAMYFNRIVEGTFLKSASFEQLWPDLLVLLIYPFVVFLLAWMRFRKVGDS